MSKYTEHITKSGHKIRIWDDISTHQERARLMNRIFKIPFGFGFGYDTLMAEQHGTISCRADISADMLKKKGFINPSHLGLLTIDDIAPFLSLDHKEAEPIRDLLKGRVMPRAWVNAGTIGDPHFTHVDSNFPDALVLLQYVNLKWEKNWDGYTIFRSQDTNEIEYVSEFVPGRVVVFDGDIPHKPTIQTPSAPNFRFTINSMWVKEEDYFKQVSQ